MQVFSALPRAPLSACALSIGTFDGVHRGHQTLIETLRREAAARALPAAALTFTDMPICFFRPDDCPRLLTLPHEKTEAFRTLDIDRLFMVPFDKTLAAQTAEAFVREILVQRIGMKLLVVGPDFALGKNRAGDVARLTELGASHGFTVKVLSEKLEDGGEAISSTRARQCVESGDMTAAARLLGRPFSLGGEVVGGQQLGRKIGVPTINIEAHPRKVLPAYGIYAARAFFDDEDANDKSTFHRAALNIGVRPTVGGERLAVEFHVSGENIEVPPRTVRLEIIEKLRDEWKFSGIPELVAQMRRDIVQSDEILARYQATL